ncbi:unnamed protein product [marine sediment metagenome]|uniref:Uncharacterized protein n=1 Tax=marine sediment metagenome TaxID=412755 RepID=X1BLA1_9ZZZZ
MNYEEITDILLREVMKEFKMERTYQEFLDSLVKFDDFKNLSNKAFQEYIDNKEI